jgi:hypothetical protein
MKNQYFGDINDYRKYGLLRALRDAAPLQILVAWILTPDDGSTDGKFTTYLDDPINWRRHDPELFDGIKALMPNGALRSVHLIEGTNLLPGAVYHSAVVPDAAPNRNEWFQSLQLASSGSDFVFLDPDNGLEIKSRPFGRQKSSKFTYWREIEAIWKAGRSVLIYQHFIREKRPQFVQRMLASLHDRTPGSFVEAFSTANVVFLMALQPEHHKYHKLIVGSVQERWGNQIVHWNLADAHPVDAADS